VEIILERLHEKKTNLQDPPRLHGLVLKDTRQTVWVHWYPINIALLGKNVVGLGAGDWYNFD
jgi:hypothetical protein